MAASPRILNWRVAPGSASARCARGLWRPARPWCGMWLLPASTATRFRRFLDLDGCRLINPKLPVDDLAATASDPLIRSAFRERLTKFLASATGSSTRITRHILLDTPLSIDRGEITDKGSINQRAVLDHRAGLIDELYSPTPAVHVITLG